MFEWRPAVVPRKVCGFAMPGGRGLLHQVPHACAGESAGESGLEGDLIISRAVRKKRQKTLGAARSIMKYHEVSMFWASWV